jgi:N-acetylglucosamine malate deacetylase 1
MNNEINKQSIVVVMAHPDDAELTCFGTLLKYQARGYTAHVIVVSTGERGIAITDRQQTKQKRLPQSLRFQESLAAFATTDISLECLNYEDGQLHLNTQLISLIETRLKELQTTLLITHFVSETGFDHQDHHVVGKAALNAALRCSFIQQIWQTEPLHPVKNNFQPNYFVNITNYFDQKMTALAAHHSQAGRTYLTRDFHELRSRYHALSASTKYYNQGLLFEAFVAKSIIDL